MRTLALTVCAAVSGVCAATASTAAQTPQDAAVRMEAFLGGFPDLGPGYAVVAVTSDEVLIRHVEGVRRVGTGAPLTAQTPVYIASQTKAYMGVLAARLDAEYDSERLKTLIANGGWADVSAQAENQA